MDFLVRWTDRTNEDGIPRPRIALARTVLFRSPPRRSPPVSVLPSPPESSLTVSSHPITDYYRAARPVVSHVLASLVTDPRASLSSVSALTAAVSDFASTRRLDYATRVVAAPPPRPLSVGGESALGCDVLEDTQFELEFLAVTSPSLCAMLLSLEGDPDALDIPTPRTYRQAVSGKWASLWKAAMDVELASWRSTSTYDDAVPPPRANVVDGMWLFKAKGPGTPGASAAAAAAAMDLEGGGERLAPGAGGGEAGDSPEFGGADKVVADRREVFERHEQWGEGPSTSTTTAPATPSTTTLATTTLATTPPTPSASLCEVEGGGGLAGKFGFCIKDPGGDFGSCGVGRENNVVGDAVHLISRSESLEDAPNEEGVVNSGPTLPKTPSCVVEATGIVSCAGAVVKGDSVEVTIEGMKRCHVPMVIQIIEGAPKNCRGSGVKLALEQGRDAGVDEANSPSVGNTPGGMASVEISQLGGVRRLIGSGICMKGSSQGVSSKGCLVGIHQSRVCRYLLRVGGEARGISGIVRNEASEIGRARCFARMGWWRRRFNTKEGRWLGLKAIRFGKDNGMEVDTANNGGAEDTGEAL
ncbi:unnamed protein product [Closterium sp. NIES-54]